MSHTPSAERTAALELPVGASSDGSSSPSTSVSTTVSESAEAKPSDGSVNTTTVTATASVFTKATLRPQISVEMAPDSVSPFDSKSSSSHPSSDSYSDCITDTDAIERRHHPGHERYDDSSSALRDRSTPIGQSSAASIDIGRGDETRLAAISLAKTRLPSLAGDEIETGTRLKALSVTPKAHARPGPGSKAHMFYLAKQEAALQQKRGSLSRSKVMPLAVGSSSAKAIAAAIRGGTVMRRTSTGVAVAVRGSTTDSPLPQPISGGSKSKLSTEMISPSTHGIGAVMAKRSGSATTTPTGIEQVTLVPLEQQPFYGGANVGNRSTTYSAAANSSSDEDETETLTDKSSAVRRSRTKSKSLIGKKKSLTPRHSTDKVKVKKGSSGKGKKSTTAEDLILHRMSEAKAIDSALGDGREKGTSVVDLIVGNGSPVVNSDFQIDGDKVTGHSGFHEKQLSVSFESPQDMEDKLDEIRRASRRKWWSPTRCMDWCMHKSLTGKLFVMLLTWTTVVDYGKDIYVFYHLLRLNERAYAWVCLLLMFLSCRLMLYVRTSTDTPSLRRLFMFYPPFSMVYDSPLDRKSDVAVCCFSEAVLDVLAPFMPLYLAYLSIWKSIALTFPEKVSYENPRLLSFSVIECIFEAIPQMSLQLALYVHKVHNSHGKAIPQRVFVLAAVVTMFVLIRIPLIIWWNWRIVYKLEFKRAHNASIHACRFHPYQDIVATGSYDHTVLVSHIIADSVLKAKRVLNIHLDVNCLDWSHDGDLLAVGGRGVEIWDWRNHKVLHTMPKKYSRNNPLRKKKRYRSHEVVGVAFSSDRKTLCFVQGKYLYIWDVGVNKERFRIRVIQNDGGSATITGGKGDGNERLRKDTFPCDVLCVDVSPNAKYVAVGTLIGTIKMYDIWSGEVMRVFHGHSQGVNGVRFDHEGRYLLSCSSDSSVRMFDIVSGEQIKQFDLHESEVTCLSIDYSNRFVVSGDKEGVVHMFYLTHATERKALRRISVWGGGRNSWLSPTRAVLKLAITPKDDLLSDSTDLIKSLSLRSSDERFTDFSMKRLKQSRKQQSRSGLSASDWDVEVLELVAVGTHLFEPPYYAQPITSIDFSPYGVSVAVAFDNGKATLIELPAVFSLREAGAVSVSAADDFW